MSITTANGRCELCNLLVQFINFTNNTYNCHSCGFRGIVDDSVREQIEFVKERYPQAVCHQYKRPEIIYSVDNIKTKTAYEITKDSTRLVVIACGDSEEEAWENAKLRIIKDEMKAIIAAEEFAAIQETEAIERENKAALEKERHDERGRFISTNDPPFRGRVNFEDW